MKTGKSVNYNKSVVCKVFDRITLLFKMQHAPIIHDAFAIFIAIYHCTVLTHQNSDIASIRLFLYDYLKPEDQWSFKRSPVIRA